MELQISLKNLNYLSDRQEIVFRCYSLAHCGRSLNTISGRIVEALKCLQLVKILELIEIFNLTQDCLIVSLAALLRTRQLILKYHYVFALILNFKY